VPHALVLLAAGLGRRFGGPKQLVEVGPAGEPLFVLTARAALAGGFDRVVVVTRAELRERVEELSAAHLSDAAVEIVLQDAAGPVRERPWGAAHAVVVGAANEHDAIGVANADDFYGDAAVAALATATAALGDDEAVVVGYPLGETLSSHGPVNRALCGVNDAGAVVRLEECLGLHAVDEAVVDASGRLHDPAALVSMNLLGLGRGIVRRLAERFERFAPKHLDDVAEMVLPTELAALLDEGAITMRCVRAGSRWAGLTHRADVDDLRRAIATDAAR